MQIVNVKEIGKIYSLVICLLEFDVEVGGRMEVKGEVEVKEVFLFCVSNVFQLKRLAVLYGMDPLQDIYSLESGIFEI